MLTTTDERRSNSATKMT